MGAHLGYSTRKPPIDQYGDGRKNSICTYIHTRKNARTHATHIPTIRFAKLIYRTLLLKRSTQPDPSIGKRIDRKSTRLNSSHVSISYAVFCLKKKKK